MGGGQWPWILWELLNRICPHGCSPTPQIELRSSNSSFIGAAAVSRELGHSCFIEAAQVHLIIAHFYLCGW